MAELAQSLTPQIEARLAALLKGQGAPATLGAAMRHGTLDGGKRLRPLMLIASADLFCVPRQCALDVAVALELVHCYSLIHDDLPAMDDDNLRRGKPTVHKAFSEAVAILAGDGLLTLAFETICAASDIPPAIQVELCQKLAHCAGSAGMVGGQCLDIEEQSSSHEAILMLQNMKTGRLFEFACEAGAILGQAHRRQRDALVSFAQSFGAAFQISDDLLDAEGSQALAGKRTGKDQDKPSMVSLYGVPAAHKHLQGCIHTAIEHINTFQGAQPLVAMAEALATRQR